MISPRSVLVVVLVVIVFAAGVYGGMRGKQRWSVQQQLDQPGWCCMPARKACVVRKNNDECQTSGGILFNWDRELCGRMCFTSGQMPTAR